MVPLGPCLTVAAGHGSPGAWLDRVQELAPALVARASRLRAVSMDMTGGYAKSVRQHAPQATVCIDAYHEALNHKVRLITRRAYGFHSAKGALALIMLTRGPITLHLPRELHALGIA